MLRRYVLDGMSADEAAVINEALKQRTPPFHAIIQHITSVLTYRNESHLIPQRLGPALGLRKLGQDGLVGRREAVFP